MSVVIHIQTKPQLKLNLFVFGCKRGVASVQLGVCRKCCAHLLDSMSVKQVPALLAAHSMSENESLREGTDGSQLIVLHIPERYCKVAVMVLVWGSSFYYYYYYYYYYATCHRPFLPGMFLEPAVNPIAQVSSFTL